MIETHFSEWLELALRWSHLTVGIAWIGASFYFNWLENRLERRQNSADASVAGDLWAIHGGGFYYVQKYQVAPSQLPKQLHWFKWEAYSTWFTGLALLVLIYYVNARVYLTDPAVMELGIAQAILTGVGSLVISWLFYDLLCRSPVGRLPIVLAVIVFLYFCGLTYTLCEMFSGRGAFIHVGAAIGTIMVLNVMAIIIPSQKSLVSAMANNTLPDARLSQAALIRSRHNNYLTLPVLFIMISIHYPSTYGGDWNWLILIGLAICGVMVRHYFNVRHLNVAKWYLPLVAVVGFILIAVLTVPSWNTEKSTLQSANIDNVRNIIYKRCTVCHSITPVQPGFATAPGGIVMDNDKQIIDLAPQIYKTAVATHTMPVGNLTSMSEAERETLASWFMALNSEQ